MYGREARSEAMGRRSGCRYEVVVVDVDGDIGVDRDGVDGGESAGPEV